MSSRLTVERGTGLLLLLIAGATTLIMTVGRLGLGAARPDFQEDFPALARDPDPFFAGLLLSTAMAIGLIAAAAGLYRTFHHHGPALASIGACGLLASGVLLLVTTVTGRALLDLAAEWHAAGVAGDAVWTAARAVALVYEALAGVSFMLMLGSLAAFGALTQRSGVLPRRLGGLALLSGLSVVLGLGLARVVEGYFLAFLGGLAAGLIWFLITGVWLLIWGAAMASDPEPA